nr:hypothetical protein [Oscillospiraceae bacterium]
MRICDSLSFLKKDINVEELFFILAKTVSIVLDVVTFAMLARALLPFFVDPMESRAYGIACYLTEPFIAPVRGIMIRLNIGQDSPIDWAFSITYIIILLLGALLPAI